jgi:CubicO group peptidase (beta-lactamase class C family)
VREVAQELVVLYQRRVNAEGHAFPTDTPWQKELEDGFPYVETPDQLQAIVDVKADMESEHPMDRLVCGDVGFGKTEIAIRAAFKAIQDGKQVAVLVPTTLLAQQHHITFADLYSHRSGLPGLFGNTLEHIGYTRDEILARLPLIPLDPFRATYSYSNFGMTAGGDAAAKVGETWTFGPTRRPDAQAPAGGVSSSLTDVTTWVRLVLGGGTLDGEEIIGKDALATTHVPHIVRAPLSSYDAQPELYGLGWNVETDHLDFLRWSHSGAFSSGASTTTVLLPQEHLGIVVLTNGMPQGVPEIIARGPPADRSAPPDPRLAHGSPGSGRAGSRCR